MSKNKHLTPNQLSALSVSSFGEVESDAVQRHLLMCDECRNKMPLPSVDELWASVLMENELDESGESETSGPLRSPVFSWFSYLWNFRSGLIWAAGAAVILLGLMFLIRTDVADSKREVVQVADIKNEHDPAMDFTPPREDRGDDEQPTSLNTNRAIIEPGSKKLKTDLPGPKQSQNNVGQSSPKNAVKDKPLKISETRGVSGDCTGEKAFEMEFSPVQENYVFKWKKLPKAVKYHLYISDDDEILIEEFETLGDTSFILRKPLDPGKTYKWKIIITLENGQTVVGPSSIFTIKDFQTSRLKPEKKQKAGIRCTAND